MVGIDSRPAAVALAHRELGGARAAALGEAAVGELARGLVAMGVRRLIVAGGESSGAVAAALDVAAVHIGAEICTGVPWTITLDGQLGLVFKSGNFGGPDFFTDAITSADRTTADDAP
jgi:uncharacterized protein YgbK (DUF1537 family)